VFFSEEMEMEQFIRHPRRLDPTGSSPSRNRAASRIADWVWPPVEPDVASEGDADDAPAWSVRTMHWVPLVVPAAALLMLGMAVLVGTRLY
jgi:hypothetical protein